MGKEFKLAQMLWAIDDLQKLHDFATTFNELYKKKVEQLRTYNEIDRIIAKTDLKVGYVNLNEKKEV